MAEPTAHTPLEDFFALVSAAGLISLGVFFLQQANLLSGGTAGLALVLSEVGLSSFGRVFFVVNLPFYLIAWRHIGHRFTLNTLVAVTVISVCTDHLGLVVEIRQIGSVYAAVIAGLLTGCGMLILFRHNASLGGVGILAVYLQKRFGFPAGYTLLAADLSILGSGFLILPWWPMVLSAVSAALVSAVLVFNHKPYRYQLR